MKAELLVLIIAILTEGCSYHFRMDQADGEVTDIIFDIEPPHLPEVPKVTLSTTK